MTGISKTQARLARDTQVTDLDQMLALVVDAYGAAAADEIDDFAQHAVSLTPRETHNRRQRQPDRGFSAWL